MDTTLDALEQAAVVLRSQLVGSASPWDDLLAQAPRLALGLAPGCEHASLTVMRDGHAETVSATGEDARRFDALQYELGEGPCLSALSTREVVHAPDLARDARWPRLATRPHESLVRSALSLPLTAGQVAASLNLAARRPEAFAAVDRQLLQVYAAYVTALLAGLRQRPEPPPGDADEHLLDRIGVGLQALRDGVLDVRPPAARTPAGTRLTAAFEELAEHLRSRQARLERLSRELAEPLRSGLMVLDAAAGLLQREQPRLSPTGRRALQLLVTELRWHSALALHLSSASRALSSDADPPPLPARP